MILSLTIVILLLGGLQFHEERLLVNVLETVATFFFTFAMASGLQLTSYMR
jgi:hypothetical protein